MADLDAKQAKVNRLHSLLTQAAANNHSDKAYKTLGRNKQLETPFKKKDRVTDFRKSRASGRLVQSTIGQDGDATSKQSQHEPLQLQGSGQDRHIRREIRLQGDLTHSERLVQTPAKAITTLSNRRATTRATPVVLFKKKNRLVEGRVESIQSIRKRDKSVGKVPWGEEYGGRAPSKR